MTPEQVGGGGRGPRRRGGGAPRDQPRPGERRGQASLTDDRCGGGKKGGRGRCRRPACRRRRGGGRGRHGASRQPPRTADGGAGGAGKTRRRREEDWPPAGVERFGRRRQGEAHPRAMVERTTAWGGWQHVPVGRASAGRSAPDDGRCVGRAGTAAVGPLWRAHRSPPRGRIPLVEVTAQSPRPPRRLPLAHRPRLGRPAALLTPRHLVLTPPRLRPPPEPLCWSVGGRIPRRARPLSSPLLPAEQARLRNGRADWWGSGG